MMFKLLTLKVSIAYFLQPAFGTAECECGFRVTSRGNPERSTNTQLFTDSVQTDFRGMTTIGDSLDWKVKNLRLEYDPNKNQFGRIVEERNIVFITAPDNMTGVNNDFERRLNVQAGLQLIVRSELVEGNLVSGGQIQSRREDVRFGSFRAYMKSTAVNGTCAASFWYRNDTQEIDIELLSRQRIGGRQPINLSVHSKETVSSISNHYTASDTGEFIANPSDFDPAENFHEYRYDWLPNVISFWSDDRWLGDISESVPKTPGYFQLSHWSNGFAGWSAGPPLQDAIITVAYFRGYFNSTDPKRVQDFETRCGGHRSAGRVCDVANYDKGTEVSASCEFQ